MPAAPAQICAFSPEDATELVADCERQLSDLQRRECQIGGPFNERKMGSISEALLGAPPPLETLAPLFQPGDAVGQVYAEDKLPQNFLCQVKAI
jgi:hypothetical protein